MFYIINTSTPSAKHVVIFCEQSPNYVTIIIKRDVLGHGLNHIQPSRYYFDELKDLVNVCLGRARHQ